MNKDYVFLLKTEEFKEVKSRYERNGTVSWSTFNSNQSVQKQQVVEVNNADFATGTLRVKQPCMIRLTENILFNPNRPTTWLATGGGVTGDFTQAVALDPNRTLDWWPDASVSNNTADYLTGDVAFAYGLGFFAAIAIEAEYVFVDLNGYTIEQHKEHRLQQRFFAVIELADQPFIPFQGPSNFGAVLRPARNCWIFNGTIGRSSHHGIHGNQADCVIIQDVEFDGYEVGAIALNGTKNLFLDNNVVIKNSRDVPVIGTYSVARFLKNFVNNIPIDITLTPAQTAMGTLNNLLDETFNKIIFDNLPVDPLFLNPSKIIDGNAYGFLLNPKGVAVNSFLERRNNNKSNETTNIYINNCSVNGVHANIREIIAVGNGNGKAQVDTAGAVLQFFNLVSTLVGDKYYYNGNELSDVQIELARIKHNREDINANVSFFGTLNITRGIVLWKDNAGYYFKINVNNKLQLFNGSDAPVMINSDIVEYEIFCNGDTMFHVNKGTIGLKIDGANNITIKNTNVSDIKNTGATGSEICGNYIKSHPDQNHIIGYSGAQAFGASLCAVNDYTSENLHITEVESVNGTAYGITLQNDSFNCNMKNTNVDYIRSSVNNDFDPNMSVLPNKIPISRALYVDTEIFNVTIENFSAKQILNNDNNPYKMTFDINSAIVMIK